MKSYHPNKDKLARERAQDASLDEYLTSIHGLAVPSDAQVQDLARRMRGGVTRVAKDARDALVTGNLLLVVSVASHYAGFGVPLLDLIQSGNEGLVHAVDRYNPAFKCMLSTYAVPWIRQACVMALVEAMPIKPPRRVFQDRNRLWKVERDALADGVILGDADLCKRANLTPARLAAARDFAQIKLLSMETVIEETSDGAAVTLGDTVADTHAEQVTDYLTREAAIQRLYLVMRNVLTARERVLIAMRYGLGNLQGKQATYGQIATALTGVSGAKPSRPELAKMERIALAKMASVLRAVRAGGPVPAPTAPTSAPIHATPQDLWPAQELLAAATATATA